jgi:hypothetical protein
MCRNPDISALSKEPVPISQQYVYAFDYKHKKPPMQMKDLLGGKGAILPERLRGLPYIDVAAFVPRDFLWMYPAVVLTLH